MVRIKMTSNKAGSPDGFSVNHYLKGQEYEVPEGLAQVFVEDDNVAEVVTAAEAEDPIEAARIATEKAAAAQSKAEAAAKAKAEKDAKQLAKQEAAAKAKQEKADQVAKNKALKGAPKNKADA